MKKALRLFALLLVVLIALVSCKDDPVSQVVAQRTPTIKGSVSIPSGSGLSGSDFFVRVMEGEKAVYTGKVGSNGSFSISGLKEDVAYNILLTTEEPGDVKGSDRVVSKALTDGYGGWMSNVSASVSEQADIGLIKVKPLGTIRGVVTKDGAEDGYDTTVYIPGTSFMAMTDADGSFTISNVPQHTYTLRYTANGYLARMVDGIVLYSESDTENPDISVPAVVLVRNTGDVEGYAIFDEATDSSGISVKLESADGLNNYVQLTAANGFYRFTGVEPGTYRVVASYANYPSQVSVEIPVAVAMTSVVGDKLILLENIGTISGSASLSDNPNVTSGINILFENADDGRTYTTITGDTGTFSKAVKPGTYKVTASYAGYSSQSQNVFVSQNNTVNVVIPSLTTADGAISGSVVLEGSLDASGAIVSLVHASDPSVKASTITDADGSFAISGLKVAGQYYITVTKDGYVKNSSGMAFVSLGTVYNVPSITLKSLTSSLSGIVTLNGDSESEFTGINVMLRSIDGSVQYDATTDQEGNYTMNNVLPGVYSFYASKAGYVDKVVNNVTVESAVDKVLDPITLQIGVRSVTGSVALELRDDYAGALITATNLADETVYSAISNSEGQYTLSGMKPGQYRIVITNANYRTATLKTINVVESKTLELPVEVLEITRGTISGVATLEGRSDSSGILVEVRDTAFFTYTDANGEYSLSVPEGNYSGIRFSHEDYKTLSESLVVALFSDNVFPIENKVLEATHVSVYGNVSVSKADDNAGVVVSFDDYDAEPVVTAADGAFRFDHVPVGSTYTLRFERENTAAITVKVDAKASDGIRIKDVVLVPDAAGVEGIVKLESGINNGNVMVKINTGTEELSTTTNYAGSYYLGGIPTGKEFTVEYSKDGWISETQTISALDPLEVRTLDDVTMLDVTVPTLSRIEINGGATVTGSKLVSVLVDAEDRGSGLGEMSYYWNGNKAYAEVVSFARMTKVELPDDANAEYTLTVEVWDNAGNKAALSASDTIELVGQITTIQGILSGDDLHWTTDKNPIVIMGDVTVPMDKTLEIDPGVDVFFAGNYSIIVSGKIKAAGTENKPIVFDSTKDHLSEEYLTDTIEAYDGYWGGIVVNTNDFEVSESDNNTFKLVSGSILSYCNIYNLANGITGRVFIDHCRIETRKSALGKYSDGTRFKGYLLNSYISGGVAIDDWDRYSIYGNIFDGTYLSELPDFKKGNHWDSGTDNWVAKAWHEDWWDESGSYYSQRYSEFDFNGIYIEGSYYFQNNRIVGYKAVYLSYQDKILFNSFESCRSILLRLYYGNNKSFRYNEFSDITDTIRIAGDKAFSFNNIHGVSDEYVFTVIDTYNSTLDFSNNYWGDHTSELQTIEKYGIGYSSFLKDGYVTSGSSIIDWSSYATEPWSFAGYRGDNIVDLVISDRIAETAMDEDVVIPFRSTGDRIDYVRYSQSTSNLNDIPWTLSDGSSITIPVSEIDMNKVSSDGYLTFYVQGKSGNEETPVSIVTVARDYPRITDMSLSTDKATDDSTVTFYYRLSDAQSYGGGSDGRYAKLYLDDIVVTEWADRYFSDYNHSCGIEPYRYMNGEHTLKLVVADQAGNETSADIPFAIERAVPTTEGLTFDGDTVLPEEGTLDVSLEIKNAKRLSYVRFYSDGVRVYEKYCYSDNAGNTRQESYKLDAHYLKAGTHTLYVELEDYGGNTTRTIDYEYTVEGDASGPVIANLSIKEGDVISSDFWTNVTVTAVKGVKSFSAYLDDYCLWDGSWGNTYSSERNRQEISFSRNMRECTDGEYNLILRATDYAGNTTEQTIKVRLQKTWPTVKLSVSDKKISFSVNTEISDVSDLTRVKVYAGETLLANYSVANEYNSWSRETAKTKGLFPAGEYDITVELTNRAGEPKTISAGRKVFIDENTEFTENNLEGVTQVKGTLNNSEWLHWTTDMSPVVITGNVTVPQGSTLVIDPGVDVLFEGNFSITARGYIDARGTGDNPIRFRPSASNVENHEGYYGTWKGISLSDSNSFDVSVEGYKVTLNTGSVFEYCEIEELSEGIVGRAYVNNCRIVSGRFALGSGNDSYFRGVLLNSTIEGSVRINDIRIVFGNEFDGSTTMNSLFYCNNWDSGFKFVNNKVCNYQEADLYIYYGALEYNTISDISTLRISRNTAEGMRYNEIARISNPLYFWSDFRGMQYNNITELYGNPQIRVNSSWNDRTSFDMTHNYWGENNTIELQRAKADPNRNASFIYDGYDDSSLTYVEWDHFTTSPWENAGYKGSEFIDFSIPERLTEVEIGKDISFDVTAATTNEIDFIKVAQSIEALEMASWQVFNGSGVTIEASSIDRTLLSADGYLAFYIQAKCGEYITSTRTLRVASDKPVITEFKLSSYEFNDDSRFRLSYRVYDAQGYGDNSYGNYARLYLDDVLLGDYDSYFCDWSREYEFSPVNFTNGNHTLKLVVADKAGNESAAELSFSVDRPAPVVTGQFFENGTSISEGDSLEVKLDIEDAEHLKYVRVFSDDRSIVEKYFYDGGEATREVSFQLDSHYMNAGAHTLCVELEDYSGNKTRSEEYDFEVEGESSAPVFSEITFKDGDSITQDFWCRVVVSAVKGVKSFSAYLDDYRLRDDSWGNTYSSERNMLETSISRNMRECTDGEYNLILRATDYAGNTTEQTIKVRLQKTWPTVKLAAYDRQISFVVNAELSNVSDLTRVKVYANETLLGNYSVANENGYWSKEIVKAKDIYPAGEYEISLEMTNLAGETETITAEKNVVVYENVEFEENNLEGVTTIEGSLNTKARLHWTQDMSPVVITGNVFVPEGRTLVIDPGVEVLFEGAFSLAVSGSINAIGTEEKPIVFRSSAAYVENHEGYYGTWKGISLPSSLDVSLNGNACEFNSGSILEYCLIEDISEGLIGRAYVSNCEINANGYAVGNNDNWFRGALLNSKVNGSVRLSDTMIVFGNEFHGESVINSYFIYQRWDDSSRFVNNLVSGYADAELGIYYCTFEFNTISDITGTLRIYRDSDKGVKYNEIRNIHNTITVGQNFRGFQYSNITDLTGKPQIKVESRWSERPSFDMTHNYWGESNTSELERVSNSSAKNASFIYDGYDDTNLTIVDWDGFVAEPWEFAGYQGASLVNFTASFMQEVSGYNEAKVGNPINISLETEAFVESYRIAQSFEDLASASFEPFYGVCTYLASSIDPELIDKNGILTLYVQIKTDTGAVSPVSVVSVGYDKPYAYDIKLQSGTYLDGATLTKDGSIDWQWSLHSAAYNTSSWINFKLYLDGSMLTNENWSIWDNSSTGYNSSWIDLSTLKNGEHTISFVVTDGVGDTTTTNATFTVDHKTVSVSALSLEEGAEIADGEPLEFSVTTQYSNKLREIRVYSDDYLLAAKSFTGTNPYQMKTAFSIENQYLQSGTHKLVIEVEDSAGNIARAEGASFTVAGTIGAGPVISSISIENGQTITGTGIVTVKASSEKGVRALYVKADGETLGSNEGKYLTYSNIFNERTIQANYSAYTLSNGEHEIEIVVYDFSGVATSEVRTIIVDKAFPKSEVKVQEKQTEFTIKASVDDVTYIDNVCIYLGDDKLETFDVSKLTGKWSRDIVKSKTGLDDGTYQVSVVATDVSGDSDGAVAAEKVTIDNSHVFVENNLEGVYTVQGLLGESQLHWTIEDSPVVITGGVTVPQNATLVIDPGVQVLFDGDYSILVRGFLKAEGTEENPIYFRASGNRVQDHEGYYGSWGGISFANENLSISRTGYEFYCSNGSVISNSIIEDFRDGIAGRAFIKNCSIDSERFAIGNDSNRFRGALINSKVTGRVNIESNNPTYVFGNEFDGNTSYGIMDFYVYDGYNNSFLFVNNKVSGYNSVDLSCYSSTMMFNTIDNCNNLTLRNESTDSRCVSKYNVISNVKNTINLDGSFKGMTFSNFINNSAAILFKESASWDRWDSVDFRFNHWGSHTAELERLRTTGKADASFIYDGYDDNSRTVLNWDVFVGEPWEFAGYQGDKFVNAEASLVQTVSGANEVVLGDPLQIRLTLLSEGSIGWYKFAQTLERMESTLWVPYTGDLYITDYGISSNGKIDALVQIKTTDGVVSPVLSVDISSDTPRVQSTTVADGQTITGDTVLYFYATIYDASNSVRHRTWFDGEPMYQGGYGYLSSGTYAVLGGYPWWGDSDCYLNGAVIDPVKLKNGEHNITIKLDDMSGNESETVIHFTIDRTLPSLLDVEFTNGTELSAGMSLGLKLAVTDARHLKEIRVLSDDFSIFSKDYSDNGNVTVSETISISSKYLKSGEHEICFEFEDYAGNISRSDAYTISVDAVDSMPTISGFDVSDNQVFSEFSTVEWNLDFHADKGIKAISVTLGDYNVYSYVGDSYYEGTEDVSSTFKFRVPYYSNGDYELVVDVFDFAGNKSTEKRNVTIEKTMPSLTLNVSDNSSDYYAELYLDNSSWMRDMSLVIDDTEICWWNINSTSGNYGGRREGRDIEKKELPVGQHSIKAVARSQAGDIVESESVTITVAKGYNASVYGLNKSWNENGTLIKDGKTRFLWNYDTGTAYESVRSNTFGSVEKLTEGIGNGKAAKFYVDMTAGLTFNDSKWTIEFWSRNESVNSDSGMRVDFENFFSGEVRKNSPSDGSPIYGNMYRTGVEDVLYSSWYHECQTSRANRAEWHHYAFVSDGNFVKIYVDGILRYKSNDDFVSPIKMTKIRASMDENVYIDEFRISATARSEQELWDYVQYVKNNNLLPE